MFSLDEDVKKVEVQEEEEEEEVKKERIFRISQGTLHNLCCGVFFSFPCFDLRSNAKPVLWAEQCGDVDVQNSERVTRCSLVVLLTDTFEQGKTVAQTLQNVQKVYVFCDGFKGVEHLLLPTLRKLRLPNWIDGYDKLFISGIATAKDKDTLKALKISRVINASNDPFYAKHFGVKYLDINVWDMETTNLYTHFESCCEFERKSEKRILIHCSAGISRSSTIVLAILIKNYGMTLRDAWSAVIRSRSVEPNEGFVKQLIKWELHCHGNSSCNVEEGKDFSLHFLFPDAMYNED